MSLIAQPESYSDILKRIFVATLSAGVLCTFVLASASPDVRDLLESWNEEASISVLDGVKALYVLVPLLLAILARAFLLHDKISDGLRIRKHFDCKHILRPLAKGVGFLTSESQWRVIEEKRKVAMSRTFYPYASFIEPQIDRQLVRTAADRWAWFWCTIEPQAVLIIAASILAALGLWSQFVVILVLMGILAVIGLFMWPQLIKGARSQVAEILNNAEWSEEIRLALDRLVAG